MDARPNVVHIILDQLSAEALSCKGNPHVSTPHLDRFASEGIQFARAYANHPLCVPQRASMLTGLTSFETEKKDEHGEFRCWTDEELHAGSIGWIMRGAGYDVPYAGKWHVVDLGVPPDHGFDWILPESAGYYCGQAEIINPACREFLGKQRKTPFFLTASYIQPHGICYWALQTEHGGWRPDGTLQWPEGTDPWDAEYTGDGYPFPVPASDVPLREFLEKECPPLPDEWSIPEGEPEVIQEHSRTAKLGFGNVGEAGGRVKGLSEVELWRLYRWTYYRLVEQADSQVGQLLEMLDECGLEENTVVILTSDHGENNGCHQLKRKNLMYDSCARVPLIIHQKGVIPAGVVDEDHLVDIGLDLLPTVCDYAGIEKPAQCTGLSLRPLSERGTVPEWRDQLVLECRHGRAVVTKDYKYTRYAESPKNPEQLFAFEHRPCECRDLSLEPEYAELLDEYRAKYEQWMKAHSQPALPRH
jgi:arylsulfatase A-like enzyme